MAFRRIYITVTSLVTLFLFTSSSVFAGAKDLCRQGMLDKSQYYFRITDVQNHKIAAYFSTREQCESAQAQMQRLPAQVCGCELSVNKFAVASLIFADSPFVASLYCYNIDESGQASRQLIDSWSWEKWATSNDGNLESCESRRQKLDSL
jgi:hypothetical protein